MFIIFCSFPTFNFCMTRPSSGAMYHLLEDPITTIGSLHCRYRQNLQARARLPCVFRIFGAFVVSLQRPLPTQPPPYPFPPQVLLFLTYSSACKPPLTIDKLVLGFINPGSLIDLLPSKSLAQQTILQMTHNS